MRHNKWKSIAADIFIGIAQFSTDFSVQILVKKLNLIEKYDFDEVLVSWFPDPQGYSR